MQFNPDVAIQSFVERYVETEGKKQIDNGSLYAGSPMVYYCKHCREHTETLPESHMKRPQTVCDPCQVLVDHGLIPKAMKAAKAALKAANEPNSSWERL